MSKDRETEVDTTWDAWLNDMSDRDQPEACRVDNPDCEACLLYTSPSPRDRTRSRMPSSA